MDQQQWITLESMLDHALDLQDPSRQKTYLRRATDNPALQHRALRWLQSIHRAREIDYLRPSDHR